MASESRADYACDHCRSKKLRCSRELPKCERCRPWPGPCIYSSRKQASRQQRDNVHPTHNGSSKEDTEMVLDLPIGSGLVPLAPLKPKDQPVSSIGCKVTNSKPLPVGILDQAEAFVSDRGLLSDLRQHFGTLSLNGSGNDQVADAAWLPYWIPDEVTTETFVDQFLRLMEPAACIFPRPEPEAIRKVLREPYTPGRVGLAVSLNCLFAGYFTRLDPKSFFSQAFRRNTVIATNSAELYLEPSAHNVRALAILAGHFPDNLSPNRCWSLISVAARQILALNYHKRPSEREILHMGPQEYNARVTTFWLVFSFDQSMALTFGRPATISVADCEMLDDEDDMSAVLDFAPHLSAKEAHELKRLMFRESLVDVVPTRRAREAAFLLHFARLHFHMKRKLDLIMARIASQREIKPDSVNSRNVLKQLHDWLDHVKRIRRVANEYSEPTTGHPKWGEVHLGIAYLEFQGHHARVLEAYHTAPDVAMESALAALDVVEKLIASEQSMFNGVAWQLLYQPFTPFFIVCTATMANRTPNYLEHLRSLPRFLDSMAEFYTEALQLKRVADQFVQHAAQIVANSAGSSTLSVDNPQAGLSSMTNEMSSTPPWQKDLTSLNSPLTMPWTNAGQTSTQGEGLADRVNPYFDWFSWAFNENS